MDNDRGCATPQMGYFIVLAAASLMSLVLGVVIAHLFYRS